MPFGVEAFLLLSAIALLIYCKQANADATRKWQESRQVQGDVQQLQLANETLRAELERSYESLQANSSFMANVGQEMRSPLSAVLGMNELLMHTDLSKEQRELAQGSIESAESLLAIISDLQDLARIDSAKAPANQAETDLRQVIREACATCAEGARRRKLFLNIDIDHEIPPVVFANRTALRQSLCHLLRNAISRTEKGGIVVSAARLDDENGEVRINFSVKDTGVAITDAELQTLFMPFGGEDACTRSYCGTGLGLYLCKRIVDTMGGELIVESRAGSGSEFRFTLQFKSASEQALPAWDYAETGTIR
jgi:two-component system, sensor histidine kinase